ncbi:galactose/methyl galactoside ABC transporter permease MglC [Chloroflexia bacterium SDU3-3]|nr:galactose/methyl galactoside ABC transporter permease MglC [Chloroflexia bacterium SDU3-3]
MPTFDEVRNFVSQNAIYVVLILLLLGIVIKDSSFLDPGNFRNILISISTRVIIALGIGAILITSGVDLSAGRIVGFAAVISASMMQTMDYARRFYPDMVALPMILPILAAIVACLLLGAINGFIIAKLNVPPFITTLGMTVIVYGMNSLYFDLPPNSSQPIGGLRSDFTTLGSGSIVGVPYIVLIALVCAGLTWVLFNKTTIGKNMYAIGGNREAAKVSGINVGMNLIMIYAFAGAMYGLAGVLEAARTGGATNNYGNGYELDAIAACVVGGVSTSGGVGTVPGILVGVLIFGVINYGLTFIGISPYWQQIVKGLIIVVAVAFDIAKYYRKK